MRHLLFLLSVVGLILVGCGKSDSPSGVTISSAPAAPALMRLVDSFSLPSHPRAALTQLAICVKRVRIDGDDDKAIKKTGEVGDNGETDPDDIKFSPGLIKLVVAGQPAASTDLTWGKVVLPLGFKVKRIRMKVKKDAALCTDSTFDPNGDSSIYGIRAGNQIFSANNDIEFKFKFSPSIDVADGGVLRVTLDAFTTALKNAVAASDITGNSLKSVIEAAEGDAAKK